MRQVGERGFAGADLALGHQDPDLAILRLAERVVADVVGPKTPLGRSGELRLRDEVTDRGIGSREPDAGRLANEASAPIASDEILRPQRSAVAERDIDARGVLGKAGDFDAAQDRDAELVRPVLEDALGVLLGKCEPVGVAA